MQNGKYIVYEDGSADVFPPTQQHIDVATASGKKPISAGFFTTEDFRVSTTGLSDSLNLDSRVEDAAAVSQAIINQ